MQLLGKQKKTFFSLETVNDTAKRAVKLMQDFHGKITAKEEQKEEQITVKEEQIMTFYAVFKNTENCTLTAKRRL